MINNILVFEQFLIDNEIDPEYFRNLNKNSGPYLTITNKLDLDKFLKGYFKSDFIFEAFIWRDTEEGLEFWSDISNKWMEMCEIYSDENIYFGFGIDYGLCKKTFMSKSGIFFKL